MGMTKEEKRKKQLQKAKTKLIIRRIIVGFFCLIFALILFLSVFQFWK